MALTVSPSWSNSPLQAQFKTLCDAWEFDQLGDTVSAMMAQG
jgi:hypothetical protein